MHKHRVSAVIVFHRKTMISRYSFSGIIFIVAGTPFHRALIHRPKKNVNKIYAEMFLDSKNYF